jgi:hypothetical protein
MKWRSVTPDMSASVHASLHPRGRKWNGVLNSLRQGSYLLIGTGRRIVRIYTALYPIQGGPWERYQQHHLRAWESRWRHWIILTQDSKRNEERSDKICRPGSD